MINLLKHEPSAQSPWQNTMLGLVWVDLAVIVALLFRSFLCHAVGFYKFDIAHAT
jgi:hypothetical protein